MESPLNMKTTLIFLKNNYHVEVCRNDLFSRAYFLKEHIYKFKNTNH